MDIVLALNKAFDLGQKYAHTSYQDMRAIDDANKVMAEFQDLRTMMARQVYEINHQPEGQPACQMQGGGTIMQVQPQQPLEGIINEDDTGKNKDG